MHASREEYEALWRLETYVLGDLVATLLAKSFFEPLFNNRVQNSVYNLPRVETIRQKPANATE